MVGNDYRILRNEVVDGIRYVAAEPSGLVCSQLIQFEIHPDGTVRNLRYERGCHGNLLAVGRLCEGKQAAEIAAILDGVDCHGRGTSCTDQLSRILKSVI